MSEKRDFLKEMKDVLFETHSERDDGMIEAEVCEEVYDMIIKNVPQNKVICEMVVKYMQSKIEDLPTSIATPFAFDFITQLLMSASTVITDSGDEYDPMFG